MPGDFAPFDAKMRAEGLSEAAIASFRNSYEALVGGADGMIAESDIDPAAGVPRMADVATATSVPQELLASTVVLKLNGGLGTSMGLDYAKSLLQVKGTDTFLDLTAKQVMEMRVKLKSDVRFVLMNSFATSDDTMAFFAKKYPVLAADPNLEFVQNKVPKIETSTFAPAEWPSNPYVEWCPPGHGDLYAALLGSGRLDALLAGGSRYMFVSNSDNLGATLDVALLDYFAKSGAPFMMECCERTASDKKGGHLAVRKADSQLVLREAAQCASKDEAAFQDTALHKYFNTNNLWIDLKALRQLLDASGGLVPLPMIKNAKTVDPKDESSTPVFQLETAMGAAIECFKGATAVVVPRTRFAPVKKCNDLLLLRSDAYVTVDNVPVLAPGLSAAPEVDLDSKKYKLVQQLEDALIGGGVPSLRHCTRLTVKGEVRLGSMHVFKGTVTVKNDSGEVKTLPPGTYENTTVDISLAPGLGPLKVTAVKTAPMDGQAPGTSGLRKKTAVFTQGLYLDNFVQATLDAVAASGADLKCMTLLVGGDGRYYNDVATQKIAQIAAANGVRRIWLAKDGLASTPAMSAVIREKGPAWKKCFGAFILTASHNPGGPNEDFGIKYNCENGGPAPEKLTDAIFEFTKTISAVKTCLALPAVDVSVVGETVVKSTDGSREVAIEVVDCIAPHLDLLATVFDFGKIQALLKRQDFEMCFDAMNGVTGPYASQLFCGTFGLPPSILLNAVPLDDFGGHHADPNLTYAVDLTKKMGVDKTGEPCGNAAKVPAFGAASDGDGDRNMILGKQFFVTPSDSLAILAANAHCIPFFAAQGGLRAVARSMPTSGAVDLVAAALNVPLFETPTGWKFFGNLMDSKPLFGGVDYSPFLCGEESFGTGSDHIREKDGLFAVLAWLQLLAHSQVAGAPLVSVESITRQHWAKYGRNYYCRYDYEGVDKVKATACVDKMVASCAANTGRVFGKYTVGTADVFAYTDPVDGTVSKNQGLRFLMTDGSRIVFRLSGTAGSGATVRLYLEKYEPKSGDLGRKTADVVQELVAIALQLSQLQEMTGVSGPTVIT
ncbi:UTP--glucose-1-phosphate uridylyltransferase-domain-containing protein [Pelagophyceae sp. CCMP2097]|nr:UTP--glucose-1-phosphate uridylyltransferase-domain-containing protein [Pelagophyceae sp. CCMP2097]|mmetsp:Transcript_32804/g.110559  ORF Transcript_32804/g.110559 Transcript_32804/m.110559 type:complete len:1061 (-) Transcript_32804:172-3354(-)